MIIHSPSPAWRLLCIGIRHICSTLILGCSKRYVQKKKWSTFLSSIVILCVFVVIQLHRSGCTPFVVIFRKDKCLNLLIGVSFKKCESFDALECEWKKIVNSDVDEQHSDSIITVSSSKKSNILNRNSYALRLPRLVVLEGRVGMKSANAATKR